jgi:uncharacterized protein with HEPN domain
MRDEKLAVELLDQILEGIRRVERRCSGIGSADDFLRDDDGLDRLDGITMMLIAIGETVKKIERIAGEAPFERHPNVDWKGVKGVRDFLSHHYFDVDAEVVFVVCTERIGPLKEAVTAMRDDLAKHAS